MHALQGISAALVGWCNDIVSYNKEAFREQHICHYVEGLRQWVRGSLEWHLTTDRYAGPNDPHEPVADRIVPRCLI